MILHFFRELLKSFLVVKTNIHGIEDISEFLNCYVVFRNEYLFFEMAGGALLY